MNVECSSLNIHLKEVEHEGLDWVHLAQGWVTFLCPINTVKQRL